MVRPNFVQVIITYKFTINKMNLLTKQNNANQKNLQSWEIYFIS
jgi:hypothetical protein